MNNPIITASGAIPAYACVKVSSTTNTAEVCTLSTDTVFGVTDGTPATNGNPVEFQTSDTSLDIVTLRAGGTIAVGNELVPDAAGAVVTAAVGQFVAMSVATSGQNLSAYKKKASSGSGASDGIVIAGTAANGFNYTFNSSVNSISVGTDSKAGTISGGGNSANPNRLLNDPNEAACAYRTISGGYDNTIGSTNVNDGAIASTVSGGAHHRIRRPTTTGDAPNAPSLPPGNLTAPIAACFTIDQPDHGTIGGGGYNAIRNGNYGVIAGGASNVIMGEEATWNIGTGATIAGGEGHFVSGNNSTVGGGSVNFVRQVYGTIAGGVNNLIQNFSVWTNNGSTIAGGNGNKIYNALCGTIAGGQTNAIGTSADAGNAYGSGATIGGGLSNSIGTSGTFALYSTIIGGQSNTTRRYWSTVLGGLNNTAGETSASQGEYSIACGKDAIANHHMAFTQGAGKFSVAGDAQASTVMLTKETTNATPTILLPGNSVGGATAGILLIPTDTAWAFRCLIIGRATASDLNGAYQITGLVKNNGGTVALVGTPTVTTIAEDSGASAWDATVTASSGNLEIKVTGAASTTIRWVGRLETSEVTA